MRVPASASVVAVAAFAPLSSVSGTFLTSVPFSVAVMLMSRPVQEAFTAIGSQSAAPAVGVSMLSDGVKYQ